MNLVKFRRPSHNYALTSFFDELFQNDLLNTGKSHLSMTRKPFTNIIENKNDFIIELAVPGIKKDDVTIKVDKDQLIVSSVKEGTHETEDKETNFMKREFNFSSFSQSFHIPESIDSDKITAVYEDGVLRLKLEKKETEKEKAPRSISVK